MHLMPFESNFVLVSFCKWANATQLNIHKWFMKCLLSHDLFLCHAWNYLGRNLILDICCNFHHFCLKAIIQLHVLQHGSHTFNNFFIQVLSSISFCFVVYGVVVYFICQYLCKTHWSFWSLYYPLPSHLITLIFFPIPFSTKILKTFEFIKHNKFRFHVVNECFKKKINEGQNILPFDEIALDIAQILSLHENPHSKEMGHGYVYHIHIHHRNSNHDFHWDICFQQGYF